MNFEYSLHQKDGVNIIAIKGNLIEKNQAEKLLEEVNDQVLDGYTRFVIDMSGFKYMNSTGLNVLVHILTKARKAGGEAVICCMPDKIKELLVITKLNSVFGSADSLGDAINQFQSTK
jgi:anti-sigma B factor antagonist